MSDPPKTQPAAKPKSAAKPVGEGEEKRKRRSDREVLKELERAIGKSIRPVESIDWKTFGAKFERNVIVGLGLYNCGLKTLPRSFIATITTLISLKDLNISYNRLTTLQESFGNLKNLQTLYLGGNQLTTLPESFGHLKALQNLYSGENQLRTLPESFGSLRALQTLNLGGNQITMLPESFGGLISLRELYLGVNQLSTLPECVGQLKSLKILWVFNNQLTGLPESIGQLQSLKDLNLSNNQLTLDTRGKYLLVQLQSNATKVEIKQTGSSSTPIPILQSPPPRKPDTEKPLPGKLGQIHRQFTYFCESCKIWYAVDEFSKIRCPNCRKPLKLSYLCRTCKRRFIVQRPNTYYCPICKTSKLIP
jgi:Leucine-rich repeat (LRR) protein